MTNGTPERSASDARHGRHARNLLPAGRDAHHAVTWQWERLDDEADDGFVELLPRAAGNGRAPSPALAAAGAAPGNYGIQEIMEEAETIIRDAQAEADRLIAEARRQADSERRHLYEAALETAREEVAAAEDPRQAGAVEDLLAAAAALRQVIEDLKIQIQMKLAQCEENVLETAFDMAARIVAAEVQTHPDLVVSAVREALGRMAATDVTVRLNPADMPAVQRALLELQVERNVGEMISFEEDTRVERGGCIVVSEHGTVDARPSTKLDQMRSLKAN
jgi:flagellar assembly protein FliH